MRAIVASDVMMPDVLTVSGSMPAADLASFLVDNQVTGAPVVDDEGRPLGVVSVTDVAAMAAEGGIDGRRGSGFYTTEASAMASLAPIRTRRKTEFRVRDLMTPDIYSVEEDTRVAEIAKIMLDGQLHRVLVCREGCLVGIISTSDLLGLLVDEV